MFIGKVIGVVISTHKEKNLIGEKLLIVKDVSVNGADTVLVPDKLGCGVGETVLVVYDGGAARQAIHNNNAPINAAVAGIIDNYEDK